MTDPTTPLAPLAPETVSHLTTTFGSPKEFFVKREGDKDIYVHGWCVGRGQALAGGSGEVQRGTDVEIILTTGGNLITSRVSWEKSADGRHDSGRGQVNATPDRAYRFLIDDGKGKLGPASKEAWVQACRNVPPMAGMEYERVE